MPPLPALVDIVWFIQTFIEENGWPPTRREIAARFDVGLSTAQALIVEASAADLIDVGTGARQVRITGPGARLLEQKLLEGRHDRFV